MKRLLLILLLLLNLQAAYADQVRVRLYSTNNVATLNVSFDLGNYNLYADGDSLLEASMTMIMALSTRFVSRLPIQLVSSV